jgi:hypothetical protein
MSGKEKQAVLNWQPAKQKRCRAAAKRFHPIEIPAATALHLSSTLSVKFLYSQQEKNQRFRRLKRFYLRNLGNL